MTAFNPDSWLKGVDPGERDEEVELIGPTADGSTEVRHADGTTSMNAPYLVCPIEMGTLP